MEILSFAIFRFSLQMGGMLMLFSSSLLQIRTPSESACDNRSLITRYHYFRKRAYGISIFLVDTDLPGFKKGKLLKKIGMHSSDTAELFFDDIRLPSSALLGGDDGLNRGFQFLMHDLGRERLILAIVCQED